MRLLVSVLVLALLASATSFAAAPYRGAFVNPFEDDASARQQTRRTKEHAKPAKTEKNARPVPGIRGGTAKTRDGRLVDVPRNPGPGLVNPQNPMNRAKPKTPDRNIVPGANPERGNPGNRERDSDSREDKADEAAILPFGLSVGDPWQEARARIGGMGLLSLGACGSGSGAELFIDDPNSRCLMLLANLGGNGRVSGGALSVASTCIHDNPKYAHMAAWMLANGGKETAGRVEIVKNSVSPQTCPNRNPLLSSESLPKFLGFITRHMDRTVAGEALKALGAKKTKTFGNGDAYDLSGTDVVVEFCGRTGEMLSIALRVNRQDPMVERFIRMMGVGRDDLVYENAVVRTRRGPDGKVRAMEFSYTDARRRCG